MKWCKGLLLRKKSLFFYYEESALKPLDGPFWQKSPWWKLPFAIEWRRRSFHRTPIFEIMRSRLSFQTKDIKSFLFLI